jgi:hypothetical protein
LNASRAVSPGTSDTPNAGDRELQARYPAHENLSDIAVAADGSAATTATAISSLDSILFPFKIQTSRRGLKAADELAVGSRLIIISHYTIIYALCHG